MGFFQNLKWFIEDINDANKELAQGVKNDLKEFKNDMKDLTKQYYPKTGEVIEKIDRASQTIGNARRSLPSIPVTTQSPTTIPFQKLHNVRQHKDWTSKSRGDHIYVKRVGYEHHALYIGDNRIIHYSNGSVRRDNLESMDDKFNISEVYMKDSPRLYNLEEVIARAESRLGESDYNLALNNCEHFVTWCRSGSRYSNSI